MSAAEITDGSTGKAQKRGATEGAGAGEQGTAEAVRGTSKHANNGTPNRGLGRRNVESQRFSLTKKDAPHSRPAGVSSCPAANEQSIRGGGAGNPAPFRPPSQQVHAVQHAFPRW
jgi:hypothetical protein